MDQTLDHAYSGRLRQRREQIKLTLGHLETEKRQAESNTEWLDDAAYRRRISLLNRVTSWYRTEMTQIENALNRVRSNQYGLCAACRRPIDARQLEKAPESEYCFACEKVRHGFTAG